MSRRRTSEPGVHVHIALSVLIVVLLVRWTLPAESATERIHVIPESIVTSSYVWDDLNGNGVQDPGEPPLAGVRVHVYAYGQEKEVSATCSDLNGQCRLELCGIPGRYWLRFEAPAGYSFTCSKRGDDDRIDSEARPDGSTAPFFNAGLIKHVDAGLVRQSEAASYRPSSKRGATPSATL